jgi:hypothetical protein
MDQGTLFVVNGTQYMILQAKLKNGQLHIVAEPFIQTKPDIKHETDILLQKIFLNKNSKVQVSEFITDWFLTCKALLRQNSKLLIRVKKDTFAKEIRKIERDGEQWHDIIATLNYSFEDKFWSENLVKCYKRLASTTPYNAHPIYWQIKDMLMSKTSEEAPEIKIKDRDENDL